METKSKLVLQVPAEISRVQTMSDGGLRLFVDTQEIKPEDKGLVMEMHKKLGWFLFAEQPVDILDVENLPKIELEEGEKQPSQRLRAVLFVYWEQKKIKEPFDLFYRRKIEQFIERVKEELI